MNLIVIGLIIANVIVSLQGFKDLVFFNKYKFNVLSIQKGEKFRMISSGFLHADYIHLGFNMYALYLFSNTVLHFFSPLQYLGIYVLSLLAGNYLSLILNKNNPYYSAVGASGSVTGIVYASIVLYPEMQLYIFPLPIAIPGYIFGIGYLFYSMYGMKNQSGNIGHSAHIGGAIAGYIATILMMPNVLQTGTLQVVLLAIPIVVLLVMQKKNLFQ
ncbi:rhomboid family intramembrane serine protease [Wenyingzhuangia marina]|uniref:Rhomboid family protein n=1 Tax=Wenyingzhuangia marina TaxID=1195760 RepID=A0A1M5UIT9_9FLAO|nr:rhomboid family intramembrane serine protease [Wenyingzhuangia marina]GGF67351.1 rhomboid family intramembrane serine protease [Wenyingzhuangia marina]SHH62992.1 Rhomboid family protein [Wenyingzhuangia marina]